MLVGRARNIERLLGGDYLVTASLKACLGVSKGEEFVFVPRTGESTGLIAVVYPNGLSGSQMDWKPLVEGAIVKGRVITGPEAKVIRR